MNTLISWLPGAVISALGWTIVHSLWQGAAAALLFLGLRRTLRDPRWRYGAGLALLAVLALASTATFLSVYHPVQVSHLRLAPAIQAAAPGSMLPVIQEGAVSDAAPSTWALLRFYGERFLPYAVLVWLVGVAFLLVRFAGGLWQVGRLARSGNGLLPAPWQERWHALSAACGLRRPPTVRESARVQVPTALGWWKPLVLLPLGLIANLPADQVEALLLHELAHIRRRDFLANCLQSVLDILYFHHPAVRWLSTAIREERENCCDDVAVQACGDSRRLAQALVNLHDTAFSAAVPVLSAAGGNLLQRIRRILAPHTVARRWNGANLAAVSLLTGVLTAGLLTSAAVGRGGSVPAAEQKAVSTADSLTLSFEAREEGGEPQRVEVLLQRKSVARVLLQGRLVPPHNAVLYWHVFDTFIRPALQQQDVRTDQREILKGEYRRAAQRYQDYLRHGEWRLPPPPAPPAPPARVAMVTPASAPPPSAPAAPQGAPVPPAAVVTAVPQAQEAPAAPGTPVPPVTQVAPVAPTAPAAAVMAPPPPDEPREFGETEDEEAMVSVLEEEKQALREEKLRQEEHAARLAAKAERLSAERQEMKRREEREYRLEHERMQAEIMEKKRQEEQAYRLEHKRMQAELKEKKLQEELAFRQANEKERAEMKERMRQEEAAIREADERMRVEMKDKMRQEQVESAHRLQMEKKRMEEEQLRLKAEEKAMREEAVSVQKRMQECRAAIRSLAEKLGVKLPAGAWTIRVTDHAWFVNDVRQGEGLADIQELVSHLFDFDFSSGRSIRVQTTGAGLNVLLESDKNKK